MRITCTLLLASFSLLPDACMVLPSCQIRFRQLAVKTDDGSSVHICRLYRLEEVRKLAAGSVMHPFRCAIRRTELVHFFERLEVEPTVAQTTSKKSRRRSAVWILASSSLAAALECRASERASERMSVCMLGIKAALPTRIWAGL